MFAILPVPVPVRTPAGQAMARFALMPEHKDEPCWVIYRSETGGWFTAMVEAGELPR